jgi:hypothetical protein
MWTGRSKLDRSIGVIEPPASERLPPIARGRAPSKRAPGDPRRIRRATDAARDFDLVASGRAPQSKRCGG